MNTRTLPALVALALLSLGRCGSDGGTPATDTAGGDTLAGDTAGDTASADTVVPVEPDAIFAFGVDPAQNMSEAPFPNDLYLSSGKVVIAPLGGDPVYKELATADALAVYDREMAGRAGFGFNTPVYFPMAAEPDLASFEGRVRMITLDGPEVGRNVRTDVFWYPEARSLGVIAAFGDYQLPGARYAVLIDEGVKTADGVTIVAPADMAAMLAATDPAGASAAVIAARAIWAEVRSSLAIADEPNPAALVIGTVFRTEPVLAYGQKVVDAVAAAPLAAPTRRVGWDAPNSQFVTSTVVEKADFDSYFGVPAAPYATNPGAWGGGSRANAAALSGSAYTGGSLHAGFGRVIHGSIAAPSFNMKLDAGKAVAAAQRLDANGKLVTDVTTLVPFTLWLCDAQLADLSEIPIAIATHGGTGHRSEMNSFANANCRVGVATIALDLPFHGGRTSMTWLADQQLQVSTQKDELNAFTGLKKGDAGFLADGIADNGDVADTAGGLFALPQALDPEVAEANTMQISIDSLFLIRLLKEGDWSEVQAGLSFDAAHIYHESLSFGTSYSTMAMALSDDWRGIVSSVGSGRILSSNLPVAPSNAFLASGFLNAVLGLKMELTRLQATPWQQPILGIVQWLAQRGDPLAWAPFVLRHRPTNKAMSIVSFGDSWDETLYGPAQTSYNNAVGLDVLTSGADWTLDPTVPGATSVVARPYPGSPVTATATFGGAAHTGAMFYFARACHTLVMAPVCTQSYVHPYPPLTELDTPVTLASPACAIHGAIGDFITSLAGEAGVGAVSAPTGDCSIYAP